MALLLLVLHEQPWQGIPVAHVGSSVSPDPIKGHSGKSITGPAASGRTTVGGKEVAGNGAPSAAGPPSGGL